MTLGFSVIILAAGHGKRMKSSLPKVLHPLMGKPLLNHVVDTVLSLNPSSIVTVLSPPLKSLFLSDLFCQDLLKDSVVQETPLGTGHGVQLALESLSHLPESDIVFVLAGDVPGLRPESLQGAFNDLSSDPLSQAIVLAMEAPLPNDYGRLIVEDNKLLRIVEAKGAKEEKAISLCNSGLLAFKIGALRKACALLTPDPVSKEIYITDAIEIIQKKGACVKYRMIDCHEAQGVNTQADLASLEHTFQERKRLDFLLKGVRMPAPHTVYFSHDTQIEPDVVIEPHVVFGKNVCLGKNSVIHSFSYLEGCLLHENTHVGPFARLRPGTCLMAGAKVGNFVEIKNTTLGPGSKASHLAYLGDTTVGSKANIGAGVITCNYDGYKKWPTHIGNDVFVGSNSALVAPVSIGDGALIAAGSTLTKDVPSGALTVARAKQIDIEGGAIKHQARSKGD